MSRATRPRTSIANRSSASASLRPPRLTKGRGWAISSGASESMSSPDFLTGRPALVTDPAMIRAWAFSRLGASPRAATSLSARSFIGAPREGRLVEVPDPGGDPRDVEAEPGPDLLGFPDGIGPDRDSHGHEADAETAFPVEELAHGAPRASLDDAFLEGDDRPARPGEAQDHLAVERLDEAGVDDGEGDPLFLELAGGLEGRGDHVADGEDQVFPVLDQLALAERQDLEPHVHGDPQALRFREADRGRVLVGEGRPEHVLELVLVLGGHDDHVRHVPHVVDVVDALVGRPVVRHDAGPVEDEDDRQVHEADVVVELVVGPLQERRIDGHDGLEAGEGQPRGEGHGVLLGDADVEEPLRQLLRELFQARALAHGRGDGQDLLVLLRDLDHGLAEGGRERRAPFLLKRLAGRDLERPRAVELLRMEPGRLIALALLGDALDQDLAVSKASTTAWTLWPCTGPM